MALGETDPIPCAWSDDDASSLVTLRDALRRIIAGTTTKDAAHFLKQPGQRRMTIKDAQEVAAAHLPYVESLVHRSQGYTAPPAQAVELARAKVKIAALELQLATYAAPAQAVDLGQLWVSVNDRLPSEEDYGESGDVVVRYRYNTPNSVQDSWDVGESRHDADDIEWNNGWLFGSCDYAEVSHWMPKHALLALIDSKAVGNG